MGTQAIGANEITQERVKAEEHLGSINYLPLSISLCDSWVILHWDQMEIRPRNSETYIFNQALPGDFYVF